MLGNPAAYVIQEKIAETGMSKVYRATDGRGREYAVKEMNLARGTTCSLTHKLDEKDIESLTRKFFAEERQLSEKLRHPGLCKFVDSFEKDGTGYLVTEYIPGKTLKELVEEKGAMSEKETIEYTIQIAKVLKYLHDKNIVYADLKPENVFIDNGKVILVDLGIAQPPGSTEKASWGTPGYAAPERYQGKCTKGSDIFALGVLMQYMLSGEEESQESNLKLSQSITWYLWRVIKMTYMQTKEDCTYPIEELLADCQNLVKPLKSRRSLTELIKAIGEDMQEEGIPFIYNTSGKRYGWPIFSLINSASKKAFQGIGVIANANNSDEDNNVQIAGGFGNLAGTVKLQGAACVLNVADLCGTQGFAGVANVTGNADIQLAGGFVNAASVVKYQVASGFVNGAKDSDFQIAAGCANMSLDKSKVQGVAGMMNIAGVLEKCQVFAPVSYATRSENAWQGGVFTVCRDGTGRQFGALCWGPDTDWWNPNVFYNKFTEEKGYWLDSIKTPVERTIPTFSKWYKKIFGNGKKTPRLIDKREIS